MKASLTNYKQSPRKVRLVADLLRGKNVLVAKDSLIFLVKKSAPEISKLLDSAIANAKQQGMNPENLFVQSIAVDKAQVLRRFTPKARGRAAGIRKTMSHITLTLGQTAGAKKAEKAEAPKAKKTSKKKSSK
jgi:large subunit ribosomal protein L22